MLRRLCLFAALAAQFLFWNPAGVASVEAGVEYARVDGKPLLLDFYRLEGPVKGLVVYVHGGAWRGGSREDCPILGVLDAGYAVASVDYRLTPQAPFPANVHDIKAAIRFLRAEAARFGFPEGNIAIAGSSAGGHLAALVGVSGGVQALEGTVGTHPGTSSRVKAVVSFFGASNLESILGQSTEFGLKMRVPALGLLLGGQPSEKPDLARLASPVAHLDHGDPPVLLIHGDADPQMPVQQSEEFERAGKEAGVEVRLHTVGGGKHGGGEFYDKTRVELVCGFLAKCLP